MSTNTIQLKEKLNFHQYQMIVNFLEEIGIEVLPPQEDPYDGLSLEELQKIEESREQIKQGLFSTNEEVLRKVKERYGANLV
ncbi:MAG: hypothetical protein D8H93_31700 [Capnocytophaga sp.]|jgi:hypothetical protein|uniref:hypothetical protein n=1 Tax=Capnocytophaga sp. oral taxon 863 TaxID=1227265 RepID=UPI00039608EE|nr:hypothetical protein [Capnocytophaga sp. oral taxon 863]ERI64378.1 hypothetical protein HMPREF1551_00400 [Capnocytophaga sp. oral taxon 863 str. F0517]RKW05362.1 MAG: hypothetical protein D8H93_31700 [Capnocytophaga sp.]